MAISKIINISGNPLSLPPPYSGVMSAGTSRFVPTDVPTTIANLGGALVIQPLFDVQAASLNESSLGSIIDEAAFTGTIQLQATTTQATYATDYGSNGSIGPAPQTVDTCNIFVFSQTSAPRTLTIPDPTNTDLNPSVLFVNSVTSTQDITLSSETGGGSAVVVTPGKSCLFAWDRITDGVNGPSWVPQLVGSGGGGSTSPGNPSNSVQYNSSGTFAGSPNLTFNGTTLTAANLTVSTGLTLPAASVTGSELAASTVTLPKIQNAAASSTLVGSGAAGSGASYSEITLGTNLSMTGTTLNATGGGGGSPGTPTNSVQYNNAGAFAGSSNLTFNGTTLTAANLTVSTGLTLPAASVTGSELAASTVTLAKIQNASANSVLLGSGAAGLGAAYSELTLGTNLSITGTTLNAAGGGSGSPGLPVNSVQYNSAGAFAGSANLLFTGTALTLQNQLNILNSAANGVSFTGAANGSAPTITATATTDTNVGLNLLTLGTGALNLSTTLPTPGALGGTIQALGFNTATGQVGPSPLVLPGGTNLVEHLYGDFGASISIGSIDAYSCLKFNQATQNIALTIPIPPADTTPGHVVFVVHNGSASFTLNGGAGNIQTIMPGKSYMYVYDGVVWRPGGENPTILHFTDFASSATISTATLNAYNSLLFQQSTANVILTLSSPTNPTDGQMLQVTNVGTVNFLISAGAVGPNVLVYPLSAGGTFTFIYSVDLTRWLPNAGGMLLGGRNALAGTVVGTTGGSIGGSTSTVDIYSVMTVSPGSAGLTYSLQSPADGVDGHLFTLINISTFAFNVTVGGGASTVTVPPAGSSQFVYTGGAWYGGAYIVGAVGGALPGGVNMAGQTIADFSGTFAPTAAATVDSFSFAVVNKTSASGQFTLPSPTSIFAGHLYTIANSGTMTFPITSFNGGPVVTLQPQDAMTFYWNGQSSGTGVWLPQGSADSTMIYPDQSSNFTVPASIVDRYNNLFLFQTVTAGIQFTLSKLTNGATNQRLTVHNSGTFPITVGSGFYAGDLYVIQPMSALQFVWSGSINSFWDPVSPPSLPGGRNTFEKTYTSFGSGGPLDNANTSVDVYSHFIIPQTNASQTITLPAPTNTTAGHVVFVSNTGSTAFNMKGPNSTINPSLTVPIATVTPHKTFAFYWDGDIWESQGSTPTVNNLGDQAASVALTDAQVSPYDTLIINQHITSGIKLTLASPNVPVDGQKLTVCNSGSIIFSIGPGTVAGSSVYYPIAPLSSASFIYSTNIARWLPDSEGLLRGGRNAYTTSLSLVSGATSIGTNVTTVDLYALFLITPGAASQVYTLPAPSDLNDGHIISIANASTSLPFSITTTTQTVAIPAGGVSQFVYVGGVSGGWYGGVTTGGGGGSSPVGGGNNILINDRANLASGTIAQTDVDNFFGIRVSPTAQGRVYDIAAPTVTTLGHEFIIQNDNTQFYSILISGSHVTTATVPGGTTGSFYWTPSLSKWVAGPIGANGGGSSNVVIGPNTFQNVGGGTVGACTIIGNGAGQFISNNDNTVVGSNAMIGANPNNAGGCTVVGSSALQNIANGTPNGDQCTAIGRASLQNLTTGRFCTGIGYNAGTVHQTGDGCTYIGHNANTNSAASSARIAIGANVTAQADNGLYFPTSLLIAAVGNGVNFITGTGQLGPTTSSRRYKKDIEDMQVDSSKIYDLRPVEYFWIPEHLKSDRKEFGYIAEEVVDIYPVVVPVDGEGLPNGVNYERLVVLMIAEMKKLRDRIAVLEAA